MRGKEGSTLGRAIWIESKAFRHHVEDHDGNFALARAHLQQGGSLIVAINHTSGTDTIITGHVLETHLTPLDKVAGFAAAKHVDRERGPRQRMVTGIIERGREELGFDYFTVVQPSEMDRYPNAAAINRKAFENAQEFLAQPGQVLAVAPEGTRSKTGNLLKPQVRGVELLLRMGGERVMCLPMTLEPGAFPSPIPKALPLLTDTQVSVGKPFTYSELKTEFQALHAQNPAIETPTDVIMIHLGRLLPLGNRGAYRNLVGR